MTVFVSYAVSSSAVPPASVPLPLPAAPSDDEPHAVNINATIVVQSNAHNTFCPPSFMPYWRYISTALRAIYQELTPTDSPFSRIPSTTTLSIKVVFGLLIILTRRLAASLPILSVSCLIVVIFGLSICEIELPSYPAIEISSGTLSPISLRTLIPPIIDLSSG